ncbi:glycosyltransferase family 2 protein [Trueperella sp. LYQ141]|uniref:glycosyltransferase family 2 protein n=1 Tax=Trueperella sp. LYQ141 TaxID=3391058 RepID=UPI00398316AC
MTHDVAGLVVTYQPTEHTAALLRALRAQVGGLVVIDNGSRNREQLEAVCVELDAHLIALPENTGIAHAQNLGILWARDAGYRYVILFDQDSLPAADMVTRLRQHLRSHPHAAACGPYIREDKPGGDELVYVSRRLGPRRARAEELAASSIDAAFLLASGCLIDIRAALDIGPMNESYFIDHVDLEWCLRAQRRGYHTIVDTNAHLQHSLGEETVMLPGRNQPVHIHSPVRCYYLMRNTIFLIRSDFLSWPWRMGYVIFMAKYSAFNALLADQRRERTRCLIRGLRDGLLGRGGRYPNQK